MKAQNKAPHSQSETVPIATHTTTTTTTTTEENTKSHTGAMGAPVKPLRNQALSCS